MQTVRCPSGFSLRSLPVNRSDIAPGIHCSVSLSHTVARELNFNAHGLCIFVRIFLQVRLCFRAPRQFDTFLTVVRGSMGYHYQRYRPSGVLSPPVPSVVLEFSKWCWIISFNASANTKAGAESANEDKAVLVYSLDLLCYCGSGKYW